MQQQYAPPGVLGLGFLCSERRFAVSAIAELGGAELEVANLLMCVNSTQNTTRHQGVFVSITVVQNGEIRFAFNGQICTTRNFLMAPTTEVLGARFCKELPDDAPHVYIYIYITLIVFVGCCAVLFRLH